jgi:hypothetical protein
VSTRADDRTTAPPTLDLRSGEIVEVRSAREILATLDERAALDALPFMPEMLPFCGQRFRVYRRSDKTCDTIAQSGGRRMQRTVHLEGLRCDGQAHGGCQAGCLLFWKEAWLKRVPSESAATPAPISSSAAVTKPGLAPAEAERLDRAARADDRDGERYFCQATQLLEASTPLAWWDLRQYARDLITGNVSPVQLVRGAAYSWYAILRRYLDRLYSAAFNVYTRVRPRRNRDRGDAVPVVGAAPPVAAAEPLDLKAGELVQVRPRAEILATLDRSSRNRGLYYDKEMWCFSGGTYRVLRRVERIIDEKTGRMLRFRTGCVILDGVTCSGERSAKRLFCPRSIFSFWRENWLRRVT